MKVHISEQELVISFLITCQFTFNPHNLTPSHYSSQLEALYDANAQQTAEKKWTYHIPVPSDLNYY